MSRDGTTSRKLAGTIKESRGNNSRYREQEMRACGPVTTLPWQEEMARKL